ncbi:hypothetical protein DFJ58DRAFT_733627 [Suillus subalutaceus]|uniref:uncharacterized protein n=1 Tax=Suillus subalutaceus TaxID=48586 RepID=UPI001B8845CB|nr:uncharacterized protein DFJ58DRAFT_733627 [Suillus subalutaceus]KAG1838808.1 hypothetical protein DFJ58DRAFT_733627 [Suillus subalutaceus]
MTITDPAHIVVFADGSTGAQSRKFSLLGVALTNSSFALSVITNNIVNTYSAGLSIQALGCPFAVILRFFWIFLAFVPPERPSAWDIEVKMEDASLRYPNPKITSRRCLQANWDVHNEQPMRPTIYCLDGFSEHAIQHAIQMRACDIPLSACASVELLPDADNASAMSYPHKARDLVMMVPWEYPHSLVVPPERPSAWDIAPAVSDPPPPTRSIKFSGS